MPPPTKQELWDALQDGHDAFDQAADDYINSQTPQNLLALQITLRELARRQRAWDQWVFDNTPNTLPE